MPKFYGQLKGLIDQSSVNDAATLRGVSLRFRSVKISIWLESSYTTIPGAGSDSERK